MTEGRGLQTARFGFCSTKMTIVRLSGIGVAECGFWILRSSGSRRYDPLFLMTDFFRKTVLLLRKNTGPLGIRDLSLRQCVQERKHLGKASV